MASAFDRQAVRIGAVVAVALPLVAAVRGAAAQLPPAGAGAVASFCEVTRICAWTSRRPARGLPEARELFRQADANALRLRGIDAVVRTHRTTYEPLEGDPRQGRVSRESGEARWLLDLPGRRYRIERLAAEPEPGAYVRGGCDGATCVVVRRYRERRDAAVRFGATISPQGAGKLQTAVLQEESTALWLELLALHRSGPLTPSPVGETVFALWHGRATRPERAAQMATVGKEVLPGIGECFVVSVRFRDPAFRNAAQWLWFSPAHRNACARNVLVDTETGTALIAEAREFLKSGQTFVPISAVRTVEAPETPRAGSGGREARWEGIRLRRLSALEIALGPVRIDPAWSSDDFRIALPAGTLVNDEREGRTYVHGAPRRWRFHWAPLVIVALLALYLLWRQRRPAPPVAGEAGR